MSTGDYYRFDLHKERARRLSILAQPSRVGRPRYLETADLTDWARITRKAIQRVAQVATLNGVDGADAWKLEATVEDNNFILKGGDNTDDGAKAAWLGGLRALLYRDTDYECTLNAPNEQDLFAIHHRVTSAAVNLITDTASKYTVNALTGYEVHVEGAGDFTVLSNTASTISLSGFTPGDYGFTDASRPYYWVKLKPPFEDATQLVYLDVHIEDWGMEEDSELNHNPRGAPVEWARREVLVQRVYVNQNDASPIVDYVDSSGRKHYVLKIGALVRAAGDDAIGEVIDDNREDQASSAQETLDARGFAHFDVGVDHDGNGVISALQPTDLAERLAREESLLVVGPDGDPGIYTGAAGLLEALALTTGAPGAPHTVFLRNGLYSFTGKGTLTIPFGWTIIGESKAVFIELDSSAEIGLKIQSGAKVENVRITCTSADNPGVLLAGSNTILGHGATLSRSIVSATISSAGTPAVLVRGYEDPTTGVVTGGSSIRDCQIFKSRGLAVKVELRNAEGEPIQNSARAAISDSFNTSVDSYHVSIENCRIYGGRQTESPGSFKKTAATLNVSTHASVAVRHTLLVGDENPALYVSGSNATVFRHQVFFSDCTFLGLCRDGEISGVGVPSLVSASYQPFTELNLTRVEGGSTAFDSCLWDTCHPGSSFAALSTGPLSLLSVNTDALLLLNCQVSSGRFEVVGGTSTASKATGVNVQVSGAGSSVEITGCTARVLDSGYPKALFYIENQLLQSTVSISDSSADCGGRACTGFYLVGNVTASDIKSTGGQVSDDLILTRAQVDAAGSAGLRIDTLNLYGVPFSFPTIAQVSGFRASACGGVGVAILGSETSPTSRANLSDIVIDGLYGTTSATSMGVVVVSFYGASIDGLALGGIKSCGVFCSDVDLGCAVSDITVHEVGTSHEPTDAGFYPWYGAALVNTTHARGLKFFSRSRSLSVPAKMYLGAYYSGGNPVTKVTVQGFDIQQAISDCNGIQLGRSGAPFYGTAFVSGCGIHDTDRGVVVSEGAQVNISGCSFQNNRLFAVNISGATRVDLISSDIKSIITGSTGITATGGFNVIRVSDCRIDVKAKAIFAQNGEEVFVYNCKLTSAIPQTVNVVDTLTFEMESTTLASEVGAPKTFVANNPVATLCSLICSGIVNLTLKNCTMRVGAIISQCYKVYAERCNFSILQTVGVVIIPPTASPSSSSAWLVDCQAWGNPSATHAALKSAVWCAPVRDFTGTYSDSLWAYSLKIQGGEYTANAPHADLFLSADAPRPAVIRVEAGNVLIERARIQANGETTASVIAGNMDYVETDSAGPALYSNRFGVDLFQFRNNEVVAASSGVVIAILTPKKPHEVRDNMFRAYTTLDGSPVDRYCFFLTTTEDENNAFGTNNDHMTRVAYTGNCHMILGNELPEGQLESPAKASIVTSYSVCLDAFGNLKREDDATQTSGYFQVDGVIGERIGPVEKFNSIRRVLKRIDDLGQLQSEDLREQEW